MISSARAVSGRFPEDRSIAAADIACLLWAVVESIIVGRTAHGRRDRSASPDRGPTHPWAPLPPGNGAHSDVQPTTSEPPSDQRLLHLGDRLRDLDTARAGVRAVERGAAAPHAVLVVEDFEALLARFVTAVEDEAVGVHDGGRAEVLAVVPEHRARGGAGG